MFKNVKGAYRFLVENYSKDDQGEYDQIVLFGFSRGTYTARSLAGLITKCGLLRKKYVSNIDAIFDFYRDNDTKNEEEKKKKILDA